MRTALHQTVALEHAQVLGEHLVTDALDLIAQLAEPQRVIAEGFNDQKCPLVGYVGEDLPGQRVGALPRKMFSATVRCGTRLSSW